MLPIIVSILDWLFAGWLFWLFAPIFLFGSYTAAVEKRGFSYIAFWCLIALVFSTVWHYPAFLAQFLIWSNYPKWLGAYICGGWVVATWKWVTVLMDFRSDKVKEKIAEVKASVAKIHPDWSPADRRTEVVIRLQHAVMLQQCVIKGNPDDDVVTVYPDWRLFPIVNWWCYWPFFMLSVILDPIQRFVKYLVRLLRGYFNTIAQFFTVRG